MSDLTDAKPVYSERTDMTNFRIDGEWIEKREPDGEWTKAAKVEGAVRLVDVVLDHVVEQVLDNSGSPAALKRLDDMAEALVLLADFADDEECRFDHHGGCQTHGFLDIAEGEMCPMPRARLLIAKYEEMATDD